mgnify:CR=1 FL=1
MSIRQNSYAHIKKLWDNKLWEIPTSYGMIYIIRGNSTGKQKLLVCPSMLVYRSPASVATREGESEPSETTGRQLTRRCRTAKTRRPSGALRETYIACVRAGGISNAATEGPHPEGVAKPSRRSGALRRRRYLTVEFFFTYFFGQIR